MSLGWALSDILVITKRNLIRYIRIPQLIIFNSVQPVMFLLLFNYVFGGAIRLPPGLSYIDYLMPGILVQTVLFGATAATVGLAEDMSKGMIDRWRSLPMNRAAVLAGRTLADSLRNVVVVLLMAGVGFLLDWRLHNGLLKGLGALILVVAFGFAFSWISALIGLAVKDVETAQVAGFIWIFPLIFASSVFVPIQTMPHWLQVFANHQPVTVVVDAARNLLLGGSLESLWGASFWLIGITAIFMPLAVRRYRAIQ